MLTSTSVVPSAVPVLGPQPLLQPQHPQSSLNIQSADHLDLESTVNAELATSVQYQVLVRAFNIDLDENVTISEEATQEFEAELETQFQSIEASVSESVASLEVSAREMENLDVRIEEATLEFSQSNLSVSSSQQPVLTDPLILDLDGDGLETTGVERGVSFDIDGDGKQDITSFATGGDALLAIDKNGNGKIDNGTELFGDQTGFANGFEALAQYDDNLDGVINEEDAVFDQLELVSVNSQGEFVQHSLASTDVSSISLNYQNTNQALNTYDKIAQLGEFTRRDGSSGTAGDVLLANISA